MAYVPSTQPRYYQVLADLRERIESGEIAHGERLPTERELMEQYGVSRVTVRRALSELNELGITEHRGKRGHFVVAGAELPEDQFSENSLFAEIADQGKKLSTTVLSSGTVTAGPDAASFFGIDPEDTVVEATCLRTVDGVPFGIARVLLPGFLLGKVDFDLLANKRIVEILADTCGIEISYSTQTLSPQFPTMLEASALNASPRKPLLMVASSAYDVTGRPIILSELLYNTDVLEYTVTWTKR